MIFQTRSRTYKGNHIGRCVWRHTGNHRRLPGRTETIYRVGYSKRAGKPVLRLFRYNRN